MGDISVELNVNGCRLGLTLDSDSPVHQAMLAELRQRGAYEVATQLFLLRVLRAGDTFVDVGAHIGYFSMLAATAVGETGRVIAIEPVEENHRKLVAHIDRNKLTWVTPVKTVISAVDGETEIYFNADNDGGHSLWDPALHPANEQTRLAPRADKVTSRRLDTLFSDQTVEHVRLMKIDTEGAEALILEGSRDLLAAGRIDFIVMEVNRGGLCQLGSDIPDLFQLARGLGYVICLPQDSGAPPVLLMRDNLPDTGYVFNILLARPEALGSL